MMKAILRDRENATRSVWLFDSFQGVPKPSWEQDEEDRHWQYDHIFAVSEDEVSKNFRMFDLMDARVQFRKGLFSETVPNAADLCKIAVLRLDGDMYESTRICLDQFYPRVSPGGFVLIDDYFILPNAKRAIDDYLSENSINVRLRQTDWNGAYWRVPLRSNLPEPTSI